ncbi:XRE family transcriptional regulator [Streptomyces sp. O3]
MDTSGGPLAEFASGLRQLRLEAGSPTYRDMARSAMFSPSVLSSAASGHRLPTLQVTLAYVAACGGDAEAWRRRWREVSGRDDETAAAQPASCHSLPRPAQLPLRPSGFVSRTEELRLLRAPSTAPVVISGPAGVGKSELALRYAHDAAAPDGQLYADFGPLSHGGPDTQAVVDGFLRALGVPAGQLSRVAEQRAGLYRSLLAERGLTVLLENVVCERQVRPLLAESRRSVTIVVSRTPLWGLCGVDRLRLEVLRRSDSLAMIAAGLPDRALTEPVECDLLAELCGDLPLALDIATRKLAARPDVPLCRVTRRLSEPGVLLDWLRIGDLSVRDSLASAYRRVDERARELLDRLADSPPEGSGTYAGDGSAVPVEDELIEELAEAGMLRRGDRVGEYRLDPLVRAFVADRYHRRPLGPGQGPGHGTGHGPSWGGPPYDQEIDRQLLLLD